MLLSVPAFNQGTISLSNDKAWKGSACFIENKGQVLDQYRIERKDILFSTESPGLVIHFSASGYSYELCRPISREGFQKEKTTSDHIQDIVPDSILVYRVDVKWINADTGVTAIGLEEVQGYNNYYLQSDPDGIVNVKRFSEIAYKGLFSGVDLLWHRRNGNPEYDFYSRDGSNYTGIAWRIIGADSLRISDSGELVISTPLGDIIESRPLAYQEGKVVKSKWTLRNDTVSFHVGEFNSGQPLLIDPLIRYWGTYYGGGDSEYANDVASDAGNNVYIAGRTLSLTSVATTGSHQVTIGGGFDGYLAKFDSNGVRKWATYFGGSGNDYALTCDVDDSSFVVIGGGTNSTGIATTGSHQSVYAGGGDGFLAKFDANGLRQWTTYYGGANADGLRSGAIDKSGNIYVCGSTNSSTSIATSLSHQASLGGNYDGFIVKFSKSGSRIWGSYYGGSSNDFGIGCSTDSQLNVFLSGRTFSTSAISTSGSHQATYGGGSDAFLVKFNAGGLRKWATYIGGSASEDEVNCTGDNSTNVYICGASGSTSGISTPGAYQTLPASIIDAFLNKFDSAGVRIWGTFYGGSESELAYSCACDRDANVSMAGVTDSDNMIASPNSYQVGRGGATDAFAVKFTSSGKRAWGTYYGGEDSEAGYSCHFDASSNLYLCGETESTSSIATMGSHQDSLSGTSDAFLVKFNSFTCSPEGDSAVISACDTFYSPSGKYQWTASGIYIDTVLNKLGCDSVVTFDLTVNKNKQATISVNACRPYTSPSGSLVTGTSGTYLDTISTMAGCDSAMTIHLTVMQADTSLGMMGSVLTANASPAHYQWLDCQSGIIVSGATGRTFKATTNGSYALIVTENGCTDTSACREIGWAGQEENEGGGILVYPNPGRGKVTIDLRHEAGNIELSLFNSLGALSGEWNYSATSKIELELPPVSGLYMLRITADGNKSLHRLMRE